MPVQANIIRDLHEFGGLDYRSNNIVRPERFGADCLNAATDERGNLTMRRGCKPIAHCGEHDSYGSGWSSANNLDYGYGMFTFRRRNILTGFYEEELLVAIGRDLFKVVRGTVTITYTNAGKIGAFKMIPVNNGTSYTYRCYCIDDGVTALNTNLGSLVNVYAVSVSLQTLVGQIDALASFACTYSGGAEWAYINGAHLPLTDVTFNSGDSIALEVMFLKPCVKNLVNTTLTLGPILSTRNTWQNSVLTQNAPERLLCGLDTKGTLLISAPGEKAILKYDGESIYQAGLPRCDVGATKLRGAAVAGGALVGDYYWAVTYEMEDSQGNIIEGDISDDVHITLGGANQQADITIPSVSLCNSYNLPNTFMCNFGYAANGGVDAGPTFTLDDGAGFPHSLQVGNRAFYRNSAGVLRTVTVIARTAADITVSPDYGDGLTNNEFVSAGLKINLWRNKAGGTTKYLVRTFAEAPVGITYRDNIADANLGFEYVPPFEDLGHGIVSTPVTDGSATQDTPTFCAQYKNLVVWVSKTGIVHFSDPDGPEYYVTGGSKIRLLGKSMQPVTGIGANDEAIFVFKSNEITVIRGDLTQGRWSQETISGVGCDAHYTIANVHGWIWFWSRKGGVSRIKTLDRPERCSYRIDNVILSRTFNIDGELWPQYAYAIYHEEDERYLLWVPAIYRQTNPGPGYYNLTVPTKCLFFACDASDDTLTDTDMDGQGNVQAVFPKLRWWRWHDEEFDLESPDGHFMNFFGGAAIFRGKLVWGHLDFYTGGGAITPIFHLVEENRSGLVYDFTDFAQPISFKYDHGWIYLKEPSVLKKWLRAELYAFRKQLPTPTAFSLLVEMEIGYNEGTTWSSQTLSFNYDESTSIDEVCKAFEFKPVEAKSIRLKFSGTFFCQAPVVSGWMTEVAPSFNPHIGR